MISEEQEVSLATRKTKGAKGGGTIRQRPDGRWEARYTLGIDPGTGKQIQKSVYGKTQKEVRQKLTAITAEIDSGTYILQDKTTLEQWLNIWLDEYMGDKKYGTIRNYKIACKYHIIPYMGKYRLSDLKPHMIQTLYNRLYRGEDGEKPLSAKTIRNVHGVLSKALNQAVWNEMIRSNPEQLTTLPRKEQKEIETLSDKQIQQFSVLVEQDSYRAILKFILFSGVRESEAIGLTWDCIDFDRGTIRIYHQLLKRTKKAGGYTFAPLKNDKERLLTPPPMLMNMLKNQKKEQVQQRMKAGLAWRGWRSAEGQKTWFVFTTEFGNHYYPQTVYAHFKKIAKQIGAEKANVHSLRHTYAVLCLQNGDDVKTVQSNLGHATAAFTLDVYGHVSEKMKQDSANRMEAYMQHTICGKKLQNG